MAGRECLLARFRSLSLPTFSIGVFSRFFLPYFRMRNASSELTYVKAGVALVSISIYGDRDCTSLHADDGSPVATHGFRPKRVVASAGWTRPGRVTTSVSQSISQSSESYVLSWPDIHVRSTTTGRFYDNLAAHAHPKASPHFPLHCDCYLHAWPAWCMHRSRWSCNQEHTHSTTQSTHAIIVASGPCPSVCRLCMQRRQHTHKAPIRSTRLCAAHVSQRLGAERE